VPQRKSLRKLRPQTQHRIRAPHHHRSSQQIISEMPKVQRGGGVMTAKARRVIRRMAPINSVTGAQALPQKGGKIGRIPKDRVHNAAHPGFKATAKRMSQKQGIPIEEANAELAASTRRRMGGDVLNKMPIQSFGIPNKGTRDREASVRDPIDLKLDPKLRESVALTQGNSPFDVHNKEHVSNLPKHINHLRKNIRGGLRGLHKPRKLTIKGGRTYTSLHNLLVHPE
jgi:hypothetical protein